MTIAAGGPIRMRSSWPRPRRELIERFRGVPTGNVSDALGLPERALDHGIRPLSSESRAVGPALTIRTRGGDNLAVWKGIEVADPGDVVVIATEGHDRTSTFGELFVIAARNQGVAAIVCDGMCRDAAGIRAAGVATWVAGTLPSAPEKQGPGEIGGTVNCAGVEVHAGDIVVADEDGVVVVPLGEAEAVADRLTAVFEKEKAALAELDAGRVVPEWVERYVDATGIEQVE